MSATRFRGMSLREMVLIVIVIGMVGLTVELVLLEHTESFTQWIPLGALGAGLATTLALKIHPGPATLNIFRVLMAAFIVAGMLGVWYHYSGNVEFALERTPRLSGAALVWKALRGATPALAPGALAQLGLLGLVYAWRHPAGEESSRESD